MNRIPTQIAPVSALVLAAACASHSTDSPMTQSSEIAQAVDNPFFAPSTLPLHYPPFDQISDEDFAPAFNLGMAAQLKEIEAITSNSEAPTFENTLVAYEKSGAILNRSAAVFFNLTAADNNDARRELEVEFSPKFTAHNDAIALNPELFARIKALYEARESLGLDAESVRLIERHYTSFVRDGANLSEQDKAKLRAINSELASLGTQFSQNVLAEVNASAIVVEDVDELKGLPEARIAAAAEAASARGMEGKWVISLQNTTTQPPNAFLENRDLRKRIHEASVARGSRGNEFDNTEILARVAKLRAERALLLGHPNHASQVLEDETALNTDAVNERLSQLAPAAVANARREAADIQAIIEREGGGFKAEAYDWDFYAEKVRKARFDFDESALKPYLEFDRVLNDGVFFAAGKLYGITFKERTDLPVYHPDVRVYDVHEEDGTQLAIFLMDPFARESKRGGAWMNSYVDQSRLLNHQPVVANHLNINEPPPGEPTLMSWDEVVTLFHEFGHALHGMFSDVEYPYFSGTRVPRDFVEYPSQVNEMWASWPEVLRNYAKHYQTGEAMPQSLVQKVLETRKFNQGYATTEYLAASMLDQRLHQLSADSVPAAEAILEFQSSALQADGVDYPLVPPRYQLPYFSHIMGGYSAGYYAYIWSEVLDADSVEWFKENGGLRRENGTVFREKILAPGGSVDAMELFREFRGRQPDIEPLLKRKGLTSK